MKALLLRRLGMTLAVLRSFRGNTRTCLIVEPLWGISYNLFVPYASLYMLALGCSDQQIGFVTAVGLGFQMLFSLFGGFITDKLGRRRTSLIFDLVSWSVPTLIWAVAQNIAFFLAAAVLNAMLRIVQNSWTCLTIEDTRPEERVHIFSWLDVANILAGFFAPVAGFFVMRYSLVPAVRGLYFFAFVSMTLMFLLRNRYTTETSIGLVKMAETRGQGFVGALKEYPGIFREIYRNRFIQIAFLMALLNNIHITLKNTFLGIVLNKGIGITQESLAVFPAVSSAAAMFVYIFVMPSLAKRNMKKPLLFSLFFLIASYLTLYLAPAGGFVIAVLSTVLSGLGAAVVTPFVNGNLANTVPDHHRAKIMALVYSVLYGVTAPFGYLAGFLSSVDPRLPSLLIAATFFGSVACLLLLRSFERKERLRSEPAH